MQGIGADIVDIYDRFKGAKERSRLLGEEEQRKSRLMEIGQIAGKGDYQGAASKALAYGDLPTGSSMLALAQGRKKEIQLDKDRLAGALFAAKDDPAKWAQVTQYAKANGIELDPEEESFETGPALIMQHLTPEGQLKQQNFEKGYDLDVERLALERTKADAPKASSRVVTDIDGQRGILDKDTGEFKPLGKSPVRGRPGLTATELKFQRESEGDQLNLGQTIKSLERAAQLTDKTFEGTGAGAKAYIGSKLPGGSFLVDKGGADATTEYTSLMSPEAIKEMAATLKGATTDFELRKFENILSDPTQPNSIKIKVINRMLGLARQKYELETRRLQDFERGDEAPDQTGMAEQGEIPSEAISDLLADPSGAVEFDEVFGAGAAQRILENQ